MLAAGRPNNQILERFLASIRSSKTRRGAVDYLNAYMRYWKLYEENNNNTYNNNNKQEGSNNNKNNNLIYRYDWLLPINHDNGAVDIKTVQNMVIQFVIEKNKQGLSYKAIENYTNHLQKFYRLNGVKVGVIDWDLIKSYMPENVKKTQDREYRADEVIAIEDKLNVRGKVVSGLMRGTGVRRGAE